MIDLATIDEEEAFAVCSNCGEEYTPTDNDNGLCGRCSFDRLGETGLG